MSEGIFCLVLHAHLPYVRHPDQPVSLEENWLFEAITETYIPLLQVIERWADDGMRAPITFTLTPSLCAMLRDELLRARYAAYLERLLDLCEREVHRTTWEPAFNQVAVFYLERIQSVSRFYTNCDRDLIACFRRLLENGLLEIITSGATHAVLPLLMDHPPSLRAQVQIAVDDFRECFGQNPRGIWLPECAYHPDIELELKRAGLQWFVLDTHGLMEARPRPIYGTFAPVISTAGLAAFGRDLPSARQVWSRDEGYPGEPRYRDFYRDIGFDLDFEYLRPFLATSEERTFTGIKYYAITAKGAAAKNIYSRDGALRAADEHASHFLHSRMQQLQRAGELIGRPPVLLAPYDAELFGHWWYEGPEFLDLFVRKAYYDQNVFRFCTPGQYLDANPQQQVSAPAASSWGEAGYLRMWLDEPNQWIYPHLRAAQEKMTELANRFNASSATPLENRALQQVGRELLLAQSSDWPFIIRTGTSPGYARARIEKHLAAFHEISSQLMGGRIDAARLEALEGADNLFPHLRWEYWLTDSNS